MGILKKIGRSIDKVAGAVSRGLGELEDERSEERSAEKACVPEGLSGAAVDHQPFEVGAADTLPGHIRDSRRIESLTKELAFYKRRSQEYFSLIERMEAQREEWKALYRRDSQGHQSAQALLQESLIQARQQVGAMLQALNTLRKEAGQPLFDLSKFDPKAYPVGIAEETAERNLRDAAAVPPQIDAKEAVKAIEEATAVPEGIVDVSRGGA